MSLKKEKKKLFYMFYYKKWVTFKFYNVIFCLFIIVVYRNFKFIENGARARQMSQWIKIFTHKPD